MKRYVKIALIGGLCLLTTVAFASPVNQGLDIYVNGKYVGKGFFLNTETWVPLRLVSQALGASVSYVRAVTKDGTDEVIINNDGVPAAADAGDVVATDDVADSDMSLVASFNGDTTKNTAPFTVKSRWRIEWETSVKDNDPMNFMVDIYRVKGNQDLESVANVVGAHSATSQEYESGTYYLAIQTSQPYKIEVYSK